MDIIQFLNDKNIKWFPINLSLKNGKKTPLFIKEYNKMYSYNDFLTLTSEEINNRHQYLNKYNYIWIDTNDIFQIDLDENIDNQNNDTLEIVKNYPYFKSVSKPYGKHIFVIDKNFNKKNKKISRAKYDGKHGLYINNEFCINAGEILHGQGSFSLKNIQVYNTSKDMNINLDTIVFNKTENKNNDNISSILNNVLNVDYKWTYDLNTEYQTLFITNDNNFCFSCNKSHSDNKKQNVLIISKKKAYFKCYGLGDDKIFNCPKNKLKIIRKLIPFSIENNNDNFDWSLYENLDNKYKVNVDEKESDIKDTHFCMANIFKKYNSDLGLIPHINSRNGEWFLYKNGLWTLTSKSSIIKLVNDRLKKNLINIAYNFIDNSEMLEFIIKLMRKIEDITYIKNIVEVLICFYEISDYEDILNSKKHLLGLGEYVFDLEKLKFRKAEKEDYITLKCGVEKIDIEDINDEDMLEFEELLNSIFPNKERKQLFLDCLSMSLNGNNYIQSFHLLKGSGGNGKGLLMNILKKALMDYVAELNGSFFTQSEVKTGSTNSELVNCRYARIVNSSEPPKGDKINNSLVNRISGNDIITTRALYRNAVSFTPQFKIFLQVNNIEFQDINDNSIKRRLYPHKFETSFVENVKNHNFEKKINYDYGTDKYLNKFKNCLFKKLIDNYKKIYDTKNKTFNIYKPSFIEEDKNELLDESNLIKVFVDEKLIFTENMDKYKTIIDINDLFIEWKKQNGHSERIKRNELLQRIMPYIMGENMFKKKGYVIDEFGNKKQKRNVFYGLVFSDYED